MPAVRYCPNCGSEVESSWNSCPSCGTKLHEEEDSFSYHSQSSQQVNYRPEYDSTQRHPQQYPETQQSYVSKSKTSENKNGVISLILGLIGCCCFAGLILGIIAIIFGIKGQKEDSEPALATFGIILGVCDLILGLISLILVLSSIGMYY